MSENRSGPGETKHRSEMITAGSRLKAAVAQMIEVLFSVLLVLLFFSIFLIILNFLFPSGTSIRRMMDSRDLHSFSDTEDHGGRKLLLSRDGGSSPLGGIEAIAAVLSQTHNAVKSKRADSIAWTSARAGMELHGSDAVQTLDDSSALIVFDETTNLDLGENSLIIIKQLDQDVILNSRRSFLVMVDGELRGRIAGSDKKSVEVKIATPSAMASIKIPHTNGSNADFKIAINQDKSSTITVYEGTAEVEAKGSKVSVGPNYSTIVALGGVPSAPRILPDTVKLSSPEDSKTFSYRDLPPKITFSWHASSGGGGYQFVLARDPEFHDIVTMERLQDPKFVHGNLKKGAYFWRVSVQKDSQESFFSETRKFVIFQDRIPPELSVEFPPEIVHQDFFTLKGKTEPGCLVYVMGKQIQAAKSGEFEYPLKLQFGINIIVVESVDVAGNITYRSRLITGKF